MDNLNTELSNEAQSQPSCLGAVMCSCYMCSKVINKPEEQFDMFGEIVCQECWDYNQYQALQDMGGV